MSHQTHPVLSSGTLVKNHLAKQQLVVTVHKLYRSNAVTQTYDPSFFDHLVPDRDGGGREREQRRAPREDDGHQRAGTQPSNPRPHCQQPASLRIWERIQGNAMQLFFSLFPYYSLSACQTFLPLISAPTGYLDWGLVTRWVQLMITSLTITYPTNGKIKVCHTTAFKSKYIVDIPNIHYPDC